MKSPRSARSFFRFALPRTVIFASLAGLIAMPTVSNAQGSGKPTSRRVKPPQKLSAGSPSRAEAATRPIAATQPRSVAASPAAATTGPVWAPVGPTPIPNGQTEPADQNGISLTQAPVSGRVISVAIDPTDPNTAYVGTAQGGLYRTRNGGATWTPLTDNALSLAIGSLALDPSDSSTLVVGTGESNFSGDCYAGVGVYKITNAKTAPVLSGPYNSDGTKDVLSERGIPGLAIDPNNHNSVYVGTASAVIGISGDGLPAGRPRRGLFHSTNFFSANPTFTKIAIGNIPATADVRVTSIVFEPGSSDHMFVGVADASGANEPAFIGGIYYTTNATAVSPTFTRVLETFAGHGGKNPVPSDFAPVKLAAAKVGKKATIAAVTGENAPDGNQGRAYKAVYNENSPNPHFRLLPAADGFAGGQGAYNIAVAIDPLNPDNIYVAGTVSAFGEEDGGRPVVDDGTLVSTDRPHRQSSGVDTGANGIFLYTRDGGNSFKPSVFTLHADSHMIGVAPSNPSVIYTGNDGGVWQSTDAAQNWIDRNNATFSATQFQSVAVHPTDRNFSIGGTQDNGTDFLMPNGTWRRVDFGDGGFALIDQTSVDTENVTMYHTYFNAQGFLIGFGRVLRTSCATEGQWSFKGAYGGGVDPTVHCDGTTDTFNGIDLNDPVNFYAPMALGPVVAGGLGQTVYFGTDKLYRSINKGDTMAAVSQALPTIITTIGISRTNDAVRLVGLIDGQVFATTHGSKPLAEVTSPDMPGAYIARAVVDPNNANVAYVVFSANGIPGQHIWKTSNLNAADSGTVTWTAIDGSGSNTIPDLPVNAFVVDPQNSNNLYAGTDRGVYNSTDGGANWTRYGSGLPDVAVFDLAIQNTFHVLRAATHGRGFYETQTAAGGGGGATASAPSSK